MAAILHSFVDFSEPNKKFYEFYASYYDNAGLILPNLPNSNGEIIVPFTSLPITIPRSVKGIDFIQIGIKCQFHSNFATLTALSIPPDQAIYTCSDLKVQGLSYGPVNFFAGSPLIFPVNASGGFIIEGGSPNNPITALKVKPVVTGAGVSASSGFRNIVITCRLFSKKRLQHFELLT